MKQNLLDVLFEKAGNKSNVARFLGITPSAVGQWESVPTDHAKKLSDKYKIPLVDFFESK